MSVFRIGGEILNRQPGPVGIINGSLSTNLWFLSMDQSKVTTDQYRDKSSCIRLFPTRVRIQVIILSIVRF